MRKILTSAIALIALSLPLSSYAAIAFDTSVNGTPGAAATVSPYYYTFTVGASATAICVENLGTVSGTDSTSNVQIGTGAGTSTATLQGGGQAPADRYMDYWCLVNPPTGTVTIRVDFSTFLRSMAVSYSGVGSIDAPVSKQTGSATTFAITTTPTIVNAWLAGATYSVNATPTGGTGTTVRINGGAGGFPAIGDSNAAINPIAATTMNWNAASTGAWTGVVVALEPTTAAAVSKIPDIIFYGSWNGGW